MRIKNFREVTKPEEIIKKIDFSFEDFEKLNNFEPFSNAHFFMISFYNSDDENRKKNNPHGIKYNRMFKAFGEPNFNDDYADGDYWILEYKGEKYSINIRGSEGSQICKQVVEDDGYLMYDQKFNEDAQEFYEQLFKQI